MATSEPAAMEGLPRQVLCMRWGPLYGVEYVNRLYEAVRRQTAADLRFVCMTDDTEGLSREVEAYPCPELDIPEPWNNSTWRKLALYNDLSSRYGLTGDWLFLDLDVVVTGSVDGFFEYAVEEPFVAMQNWTQRGKGIANTSVFRFRIEAHQYLVDRARSDFHHFLERYRNEQTFISREIDALRFWPDSWCALFKVNCVPPWPARFWQTPKLPDDARVVAFPGSPNPPNAMVGDWPEKRWWKKIYKQIRPTPWIETHWIGRGDEASEDQAG